VVDDDASSPTTATQVPMSGEGAPVMPPGSSLLGGISRIPEDS
jgi:hypothetical protein